MHLLVVEDDEAIAVPLVRGLERSGYEVTRVSTGHDALAVGGVDLVLLDLGLPDLDGLEFIARVRAHAATPIVVLSARGAEGDKVRALDLGADDYLTKPFGMDEMLARVRVALRHAAHPGSGTAAVFSAGALAVDLERRQVSVDGREVRLTPTEYALLRTFITHPDKVLTRRMLLQEVWGPEYGSETQYLRVYA
ncbi:MAG TPA: response regulator transcription factor, partial [Acidimicrobiales bacterium]